MAGNPEYAVFIGSPCIDEYYTVESWPQMGDKALGRFIGNVAGGMIANAACVCAGLAVKTYCFDVMGTSESTAFLLQDMEQNGVDMSHIVQREGFADTKCVIFQKAGERSIIVVPGDECKHTLCSEERAFLRGAAYVFTSLQSLDRIAEPIGVLKDLHAHGVKLVFDNEPSTHRPGWEDMLQYAHTLYFNEFSVEVFAEGLQQQELLAKLFRMGVSNVVVTLGPHGCRVATRDGQDFAIPSYDVPKVDTTGAGDTFNSSFLACMLKGWPVQKAARFANAAANMSIGVQGPRGGITTEEKVLKFMQKHSDEVPFLEW